MKSYQLTVLALAFVSGNVLAGPLEEAKQHVQAIAAGDVAQIVATYAADANLYWIGGPLDGNYSGVDNITGVWQKFTKSQGAFKATIDHVQEAINPKGATVTADVLFEGKQTVKVRYVMSYREGKLIAETWQIDPKLDVKSAY
ncbi:MAG: nuclear transport factor 2 family protein [Halothiobacillus sp.]